MLNPVKGETLLKLEDGREFALVLDFEALVRAESAYGKPLGQLLADTMHEFIGAGRCLLYGGLLAHHPEITVRQVSEFYIRNQAPIIEALGAAIEAGFPELEGKESGNAPPPGKSSGRNGAKANSTRKPSGGQRRARSN
jgi:hypothetical protein